MELEQYGRGVKSPQIKFEVLYQSQQRVTQK